MSTDTKVAWLVACLLALSIIGVLVGMFYVKSFQCTMKWEDSGMASDYALFKGCRIQHDGKWIPAESYRVVP